MSDELDFPPHLLITAAAQGRLRSDWSTDNVLIGGLADLEAFVRTQPDDSPLINAGPLEGFPITRELVSKIEHLSHDTAGKITYGAAAVVQVGFVITALKSLEAQNQRLASRLSALEDR